MFITLKSLSVQGGANPQHCLSRGRGGQYGVPYVAKIQYHCLSKNFTAKEFYWQ